MLRKTFAAVVAGLVVLFVCGPLFAQDEEGTAPRHAKRREATREKRQAFREKHAGQFENLPEAKKQAIKRVVEWMKTKTKEVLANEDLTREQKRERIARIRRAGRERIRKILGRGHKHRDDAGDADEDAPVDNIE